MASARVSGTTATRLGNGKVLVAGGLTGISRVPLSSAELYDPGPQVAVSTTTVLAATPNASTGGQLVTFTATVEPSPGNFGTVTFRDNGAVLAENLPLVGGVANFQISTLPGGSHPIQADYNGTAEFTPSTSNTLNFVVSAPTAPQILSVTVNGNIASLAGNQRSRVASVVVAFDQPVELDAGAFSLLSQNHNITFGGDALGSFGSPPLDLVANTADSITWVVTFSGNTDDGLDGLCSLQDGIYDFNIDATKVHPVGVPSINALACPTTVFHRLFGDSTGEELPVFGNNHVAVIAIDDNFSFRSAFASLPNYQAYFDFDGDGAIGVADNFQFRSRFNRPLMWSV